MIHVQIFYSRLDNWLSTKSPYKEIVLILSAINIIISELSRNMQGLNAMERFYHIDTPEKLLKYW